MWKVTYYWRERLEVKKTEKTKNIPVPESGQMGSNTFRRTQRSGDQRYFSMQVSGCRQEIVSNPKLNSSVLSYIPTDR